MVFLFVLQVSVKMNFLYAEVSDVLQKMEEDFTPPGPGCEFSTSNDFQNYMVELKSLLKFEKSEYDVSYSSQTQEQVILVLISLWLMV